jgi:sphingolipid 4-desaturase/C4-monooxygenase
VSAVFLCISLSSSLSPVSSSVVVLCQIRELFTKEPRTFMVVVATVVVQYLMARWAQTAAWPLWLLATYVVAGTLNHTMAMAVHELSHNLCWEDDWANKLTGILANLPTGLPTSITFQQYAYAHTHTYTRGFAPPPLCRPPC